MALCQRAFVSITLLCRPLPRRSISYQRTLVTSKAAAVLYYYESQLPIYDEPDPGVTSPVFFLSSALGDEVGADLANARYGTSALCVRRRW